MTAEERELRAQLRRAIVIPTDLIGAVRLAARADGFEDVQAWIVCTLQILLAARKRPQT